MTSTEFMMEEYQFLQDLKSSPLYQRLQELNHQINLDETCNKLASERDHCFELADKEEDSAKKRELLTQANKIDDELRSQDLMKEYLICYSKLRKILTNLSDSLTKEIKL